MSWATFWAIFFTNSSGHPAPCTIKIDASPDISSSIVMSSFTLEELFIQFSSSWMEKMVLRYFVHVQNVKVQNAKVQLVDIQNVEVQKVEVLNVDIQNVERQNVKIRTIGSHWKY
jgi:hypothetical protein